MRLKVAKTAFAASLVLSFASRRRTLKYGAGARLPGACLPLLPEPGNNAARPLQRQPVRRSAFGFAHRSRRCRKHHQLRRDNSSSHRMSTPEAFKAWSQNLGHENVLTTFASYGQVATPRQAELIRELGKPKSEAVDLHALVRDVTRIKERLPG